MDGLLDGEHSDSFTTSYGETSCHAPNNVRGLTNLGLAECRTDFADVSLRQTGFEAVDRAAAR